MNPHNDCSLLILAIIDSFIANFEGRIISIIGNTKAGFKDGNYSEARFFEPQGMSLSGSKLYVADRANHAVRLVDLTKQKVATVAGTGETRI